MIQFNDLHLQYRYLKEDIDKRISQVLDHGKFIMGPEVIELEKKLAEYVGVKYAISCSSGTDALLMTLMAWGVQKGDAIFTTPFTFIATSEVISLLGATSIFVDIDPGTYNIDPIALDKAVQKTITKNVQKPKAIIAVDLFGLPADYYSLTDIANKYNLLLLEDAAQSFGGVYKNKKAGSFGHAATTSFFPAKPLGCYGDGGAIFTDDQMLCETLKSIRVHGQGKDKYDSVRVGVNARLDTIQAAILLAKLSAFDKEMDLRNIISNKFTHGLESVLQTPRIPEDAYSAWAQYSVLAKDLNEREALIKHLEDKGIPTNIYYRKPLHLQDVNMGLGYKVGDFPVAETVSDRIFSLPMYPHLGNDKIDIIIEVIHSFFK